MFILPLDAFIEITTGHMSFIILGTALILPLGVCDKTATGCLGYISRAYINIATGHSMYLDYNHIQIAAGRINVF